MELGILHGVIFVISLLIGFVAGKFWVESKFSSQLNVLEEKNNSNGNNNR